MTKPNPTQHPQVTSLDTYQIFTATTMNHSLDPSSQLANMAMGIAGESGEVADVIKKYLYQGHFLNDAHLIDELGDILWYVSNLCTLRSVSLQQVLDYNVSKLRNRYPNGFSEEASVNREE